MQTTLLSWYDKNKRKLPWRDSHDPYRIWVSEVMLQQTTVVAVLPFYEKFMKRFPTVQDLAGSSLEEVFSHWAGLGYYSRARNLHKAAQEFAAQGFPKTYQELLEFKGLGPYTARAVASFAFNQKVGVLDGNVIRVLTRVYDLPLEWWKPKARQELQERVDALAQIERANDLNQALMELGATVCTPKNPACVLCPWVKKCLSRKNETIAIRPLSRPRKAKEVWIWKPKLIQRDGKIALVENDYAPFLKGQWIFPGEIAIETKPPKKFSFRHSITHHDIFVIVHHKRPQTTVSKQYSLPLSSRSLPAQKVKWVQKNLINTVTPASLLTKALDFI